jgi:excisionase family DNA binding protein
MAASYEIPTIGKLLTIAEFAHALGLSQRTVRNWIFQKRLKFFKVGSAVRIGENELLQLLARGHRKE